MTICTSCYEYLQFYMYTVYSKLLQYNYYLTYCVYCYLHVSIRVTCVALYTVYLYVSLLVQSVIPWLVYVLIKLDPCGSAHEGKRWRFNKLLTSCQLTIIHNTTVKYISLCIQHNSVY